ncbi:hypothetical protein SAMN02910293_00197 [Streptococcus henryi]|jgi:hypothetical protein|uniref:Uncharacterized protein n=2 Tax=Streptococcus henryi TaxID=439219 RepID=A0A1G6A776_9STRE|nr:hypothetical protein SAMN02910293_00197 [Streptococcus henryi]
MKTLGKIIKKYPEQALLFLFNTGVFAWLQTTGSFIAAKLGFKSIQTEVLLSYIPAWLRVLAGDSLEKLQSFFGSYALAWLAISMILAIVIRFIKGVVKFVIFVAIILIGALLIWQNQSILKNLMQF